MSNFVTIVRPKKFAESIDAKVFDNQNARDISRELNLKDTVLYIHTPLFADLLEADCVPTTRFKELITRSSVSRYSRPEYYLFEMPASENLLFINVAVKNQTEHIIPPFYVSFDKNSLDKLSVSDIISKIDSGLGIQVTNPSIYFLKNKDEDKDHDDSNIDLISEADPNINGLDILSRAREQQLYFKCTVTDGAASKLKRRVYIAAEIISTEESYVADLAYIQSFWEAGMRKAKMMPEDQLQIIFKDFYAIIGSQSYFLASIKARGTAYGAQIAEPFLEFSPVFKASQLYVSNYPLITEVLANFNKKPKFAAKLRKLTSTSDGKDLSSYLITPVQRMPRYILFLRDLLKVTPPSHPDSELLQLAFNAIETVTKQFDTVTALSKKQTELMRLQQQISGKYIFLDKQRELIFQLNVTVIEGSNKSYQGNIFFFNDLILIVRNGTKGGVKMVYDESVISTFNYKYQWPGVNSITIDGTKKPYHGNNKKAVFNVIFASPEERNLFLGQIEKFRTNSAYRNPSNSKISLIWTNIDVKTEMPALVKPITVTIDSDPYIFSNGKIYKLVEEEITTVGELNNVYAACKSSKLIFVFAGENIYRIEPPNAAPIALQLEMKLPPLRGASMVYHEGLVYIFGGKIKRGEYSNILYMVDTKKLEITKHEGLENTPSPRWLHSATVYQKSMIIYGGSCRRSNGASTILSDAHILNLKGQLSWRPFDIELPPRKRHTMLRFEKNVIMIGGVENRTQMLDLSSEEIFTADEIGNYSSTGLPYASAAILPEGDIFVVGGGRDRKTAFAAIFQIDMPQFLKKTIVSDFANALSDPGGPAKRKKHHRKHTHRTRSGAFSSVSIEEKPKVFIPRVPDMIIHGTIDDSSSFDESSTNNLLQNLENQPPAAHPMPPIPPTSLQKSSESDDSKNEGKSKQEEEEEEKEKKQKEEEKRKKDDEKKKQEEDKARQEEERRRKDEEEKTRQEEERRRKEEEKTRQEEEKRRKEEEKRKRKEEKRKQKEDKKKNKQEQTAPQAQQQQEQPTRPAVSPARISPDDKEIVFVDNFETPTDYKGEVKSTSSNQIAGILKNDYNNNNNNNNENVNNDNYFQDSNGNMSNGVANPNASIKDELISSEPLLASGGGNGKRAKPSKHKPKKEELVLQSDLPSMENPLLNQYETIGNESTVSTKKRCATKYIVIGVVGAIILVAGVAVGCMFLIKH